jgi:hypothetical protein
VTFIEERDMQRQWEKRALHESPAALTLGSEESWTS